MKIIKFIIIIVAIALSYGYFLSTSIEVVPTYPSVGTNIDSSSGPLVFEIKKAVPFGFYRVVTSPKTSGETTYLPDDNIIQYEITGGYALGEQYVATVKFLGVFAVNSLSFKGPRQSTDPIVYEINNNLITDYYPLAPYLPYFSNDYDITYIDRLKLEIKVKNPVPGANYESIVRQFALDRSVDISNHSVVIAP